MRTIPFIAELQSDTVLGAHSATTGPHECLPFLPGSVFLGAAAGRLYDALGGEAFRVFHSGKVRFLPAYPLSGTGAPGIPVPLSYHVEKVRGDGGALKRLPDKPRADVCNFSHPEARPETLTKAEQIRNLFFTPDGALIQPEHRVVLKTAIDPDTGRAGESQLFSYQALSAGQRFAGCIQLDDDIPAAVDGKLASALFEDAITIGRSRSAEFGRVRLERGGPSPEPDGPAAGGDQILLYCLTDLALHDPETQAPILRVHPEHLGLSSELEIDFGRTFIQTRRYSPVNGKRRRLDLERQVIRAGSVVAIRTPGGWTDSTVEKVRAKCRAGIGAYRFDGLGQVRVNPSFLQDAHPCFAGRVEAGPAAEVGKAEVPGDPLIEWLEERLAESRRNEDAYETAGKWAEMLTPWARRPDGPRRSQWGMLREEASRAPDGAYLKRLLFGDPGEGGLKGLLREGVRAERWKVRAGGQTLVEKFHGLSVHCEDDRFPDVVRILAARMHHDLAKGGRR